MRPAFRMHSVPPETVVRTGSSARPTAPESGPPPGADPRETIRPFAPRTIARSGGTVTGGGAFVRAPRVRPVVPAGTTTLRWQTVCPGRTVAIGALGRNEFEPDSLALLSESVNPSATSSAAHASTATTRRPLAAVIFGALIARRLHAEDRPPEKALRVAQDPPSATRTPAGREGSGR